jgi:hypothetical protein
MCVCLFLLGVCLYLCVCVCVYLILCCICLCLCVCVCLFVFCLFVFVCVCVCVCVVIFGGCHVLHTYRLRIKLLWLKSGEQSGRQIRYILTLVYYRVQICALAKEKLTWWPLNYSLPSLYADVRRALIEIL